MGRLTLATSSARRKGSLATQARPRPRLWRIVRRIARSFEVPIVDAFLSSIDQLIGEIDDVALAQALASQQWPRIEAAAQVERLGAVLMDSDLERTLIGTSIAVGEAGAEILSLATGLEASFSASDPNVTVWARRNVGLLISEVGTDVREAVRIVVALGNELGLTVAEQALAIKEIVGLHSTRVAAPSNFARQLREGDLSVTARLLHDPLLPPRQRRGMRRRVEAEIRKRIESGTVTEEWIAAQRAAYARNLLHLRALSIARTESLRAAHEGLHIGWRQAVRDGVLPRTARRRVVVTPDDRLRLTHAQVPGLNPEGRGLEEPFVTPMGRFMNPPWEPNCRCSVALTFPGLEGIL